MVGARHFANAQPVSHTASAELPAETFKPVDDGEKLEGREHGVHAQKQPGREQRQFIHRSYIVTYYQPTKDVNSEIPNASAHQSRQPNPAESVSILPSYALHLLLLLLLLTLLT